MNVVFDFGAVLFTWQPAHIVADVFPEVATNEADAKQLAHAVFGHQDWHAFDRGELDMELVITRTSSRLQLDPTRLGSLVRSIGVRLAPIQETVSLLQSLQEKRDAGAGVTGLYFLSNMPVPYSRELEQKHSFLAHFDGGIFSGDVLCAKPDPAIYRKLQSRYALAPQRTVFIDDLKANIEAARALGWHGIHFKSAAQLAEDLRIQHGL